MRMICATYPAPGRANEDRFLVGANWAILLDGATHRPGVATGCQHSVVWLVDRLSTRLAHRLTQDPDVRLTDALADTIEAVRSDHGPGCDLSNPDSPSSTATVLRVRRDTIDYLVLGDTLILTETEDGQFHRIADERSGRLGSYTAEAVRAARNSPTGFWIASTRPEAAYQAVTGTLPRDLVRGAILLTDGFTRYVERLGLGDWADLYTDLTKLGSDSVIERIRNAEAEQLPELSTEAGTGRRLKRHDDATAILTQIAEQQRERFEAA